MKISGKKSDIVQVREKTEFFPNEILESRRMPIIKL